MSSSKSVRYPTDQILSKFSRVPIKLTKVPAELHPLVPMVQHWGGVGSDEEVYRLADLAESNDDYVQGLEEWAASWTPVQQQAYEKWDDSTSLTEDYAFCKFYFMSMLLDILEIKYPRNPNPGDPIESWVQQLGKISGTAAQSIRMWAARHLSEHGAEAIRALPVLQETAKQDPSDEVRAWAITAIGLIEGKKQDAKTKIHKLLQTCDPGSKLTIESAADELDKPEEIRAVRRLLGACITNDLVTIRQMLQLVHPDAQDHDGMSAIHLAVGNNHPAALELLLKSGANPNKQDKYGNEYPLHESARRRKGAEAIQLLLQFGADRSVKDKEGKTPLDIAIANKRRKNIELLR